MLALPFILEVYPSAEEGVCSEPPPPGAAHERCCSVVKVRQADILPLTHTSSTERSRPAQDRAGPPCLSWLVCPGRSVPAFDRVVDGCKLNQTWRKLLAGLYKLQKESEGGCFFFIIIIDF